MILPKFKYHPDPSATGHIEESDTPCVCCGQGRGFIYIGPVYAAGDYNEKICPWCIADGSAHEKLDASFTDEAGIGGYGKWEKVSKSVEDEIAHRTPGFSAWQQEEWWTHCGDGGAFLGRVGREELEQFGQEAIDSIRESVGIEDDSEWNDFYSALDKEGSPAAYLFQCLKCRKFGGYHDCD